MFPVGRFHPTCLFPGLESFDGNEDGESRATDLSLRDIYRNEGRAMTWFGENEKKKKKKKARVKGRIKVDE